MRHERDGETRPRTFGKGESIDQPGKLRTDYKTMFFYTVDASGRNEGEYSDRSVSYY